MERERLALQHEPEMKKLEVHMKLGLDPTSEKEVKIVMEEIQTESP